jgi:transcriptional regulator with XRE-family HTH domain
VQTLRNRIKEIRKEHGLTLDSLASKSGLNKLTILRAEKQDVNNSKMRVDTFLTIATSMGVTLYDLFGMDEDEEVSKSIQRKKEESLKMIAEAMDIEVAL